MTKNADLALTMMTVFVTGPVLLLRKTIPVKSIGIVTAASGQQGTIARDARRKDHEKEKREICNL